MKTAIIIGSSIEVNPLNILANTSTRACHDPEERFRQTMFGLSTVYNQFRDATVYLIDSSTNYQSYKERIERAFKSIKFIPLIELDKKVQQTVITYPHKSYCEALMFLEFFKHYEKELLEHDFIIKSTGRYLTHFHDLKFDASKIYFKEEWAFNWKDEWNYNSTILDQRKKQGDNTIRQYPSVVFGVGVKHYPKMVKWFEEIVKLTYENPQFDIECLLYYFTRSYPKLVKTLDVQITGFTGAKNEFHWY
jgi:hypothetical protein